MGKTYRSGHHFPAEFGFSGSAGKTFVKGYARGGQADSSMLKVQPSSAEAVESGIAGKTLRPGYASGGKPRAGNLAIMKSPMAERRQRGVAPPAEPIEPPGLGDVPARLSAPRSPRAMPAFNRAPKVGMPPRPNFALRTRLPGGMKKGGKVNC
jgi:hypothetical protein